MCGRTSLFAPQAAVEERFDARASQPLEPRYNLAPGEDLAVVRNDAPESIDQLRWGLVPHWADDPESGPRPINARAETVDEKPTFRDAFAERRCLVIADGFYEWKANGKKQPYRVTIGENEPFAFAGLWERWRRDAGNGEDENEGEDDLRTVTIITTEANELVAPIHDRMPVILAADEERRWLAGEGEPKELLDPYDGSDLRTYPVSTAVNDPSNDSPAVVEPIDASGGQQGLDDFA